MKNYPSPSSPKLSLHIIDFLESDLLWTYGTKQKYFLILTTHLSLQTESVFKIEFKNCFLGYGGRLQRLWNLEGVFHKLPDQ